MYYLEENMNNILFRWTDGNSKDFHQFYVKTESYYSSIVGGVDNRKSFVPYNISASISHVLIAYLNDTAIACAGLKHYSNKDAEIKRVWVEPEYRRRHIAQSLMKLIEEKAKEIGYKRTILQTREIMADAICLYESIGYKRIINYPPYDKLSEAVCLAKEL